MAALPRFSCRLGLERPGADCGGETGCCAAVLGALRLLAFCVVLRSRHDCDDGASAPCASLMGLTREARFFCCFQRFKASAQRSSIASDSHEAYEDGHPAHFTRNSLPPCPMSCRANRSSKMASTSLGSGIDEARTRAAWAPKVHVPQCPAASMHRTLRQRAAPPAPSTGTLMLPVSMLYFPSLPQTTVSPDRERTNFDRRMRFRSV